MSEQEAAPAAEQEKLRDLHVLICVPALDSVKTGFFWSAANAMSFFNGTKYEGSKKVGLEVCKSSNLAENRARLVARAFENNATHVLFLDSDMKFPADTILRLLNHNAYIVAVNYPTKEFHPRPTAYVDNDSYTGPLFTKDGDTGLVEVASCGFGCMLIDIRVFEKLDLPHFAFVPMPPEFVATKTEDVYFCQKATAAGFPILIDQELSCQVSHIGDFEYTNFLAHEAQVVHQALYRDL